MTQRHVESARICLSLTILGFVLPAAAENRPVEVSDLARCAAISSADERLACYDSLAAAAVPQVRVAPGNAAPGNVAPGNAAPGNAAPGAPGNVAPEARAAPGMVASASSATAGGGQAATPRSTNPADPANFGLTPHQLKAAPQGPDSIKAVVSQVTQDRLNNVYLVLENGQTWGFVEPDPRVRPGDSVTIKRAALGSFLMMTPSRRSYRVQRVN